MASDDTSLRNFWRWFGRSKVVDPAGRPMVVYHGTKGDFRSFDADRSKRQGGVPIDYHASFFFSNSTDTAQTYAGQQTHPWQWKTDADGDEHSRLMQAGNYEAAAKLSKTRQVKNVKTFATGGNVMPVYLRMLKPLRGSGRGNYWNEIWFEDDYIATRDLLEIAVERGCDGIIVKNVHDRREGKGKPSTIYAVFSPNQIKSAIGNPGQFSSSPMIDEAEGMGAAIRHSRAPND